VSVHETLEWALYFLGIAMEEVQPRSKLWIWLFGLILGPVVLMLWLGRGRLAMIYLLAWLIVLSLVILVVATGFIAPPAFADFDTMALFLGLPFNIIGLVHGLKIREMSLARPWFSRWYVAIVLPLALTSLIGFLVRMFLYQPFNIPSGAMYPTLKVGDYLFVSKLAYGYSKYSFNFSVNPFGFELFKFGPIPAEGRFFFASEPQRGDIAVFKLPRDNETDYIKRVIGLPGDRIQMRDGVLVINGVAVPKQRIADFVDEKGEGAGRPIPQYVETLPNGVSYNVLDEDSNGAADNTNEYVVPPDHYFMMGDNRDNSLDSRFAQNAPGGGVGYVPYENILGPVVLVFWHVDPDKP
jgi:signal peptidase I